MTSAGQARASLVKVYWLEQTEADVPPQNDWLGAGEIARLNALRFPKRRADWRLGRWTAKRAVSIYRNAPTDPRAFACIEVRPAASGAPEIFLDREPAAVVISLSHRNGVAMCAVAPPETELGCDLETIEPRSDAFITDYFTSDEQSFVAQAPATERFRLLALLWSAKESALKALREGLRLDTRSVTVRLLESFTNSAPKKEATDSTPQPRLDWRPLEVCCTERSSLSGLVGTDRKSVAHCGRGSCARPSCSPTTLKDLVPGPTQRAHRSVRASPTESPCRPRSGRGRNSDPESGREAVHAPLRPARRCIRRTQIVSIRAIHASPACKDNSMFQKVQAWPRESTSSDSRTM